MKSIKTTLDVRLANAEIPMHHLILNKDLVSIVPYEVMPDKFLNLTFFINKKLHEIS